MCNDGEEGINEGFTYIILKNMVRICDIEEGEKIKSLNGKQKKKLKGA